MASNSRHYNAVLFAQALGFAVLLFITWLDEGVALPRHWLGEWFSRGTIHEAVLESVAIVFVGALVIGYTRRLLKQLHYIERFLRVCAWCKKLDLNGQWVSMERYLKSASDTDCSHGICEACQEKVKKQFAEELEATQVGGI